MYMIENLLNILHTNLRKAREVAYVLVKDNLC